MGKRTPSRTGAPCSRNGPRSSQLHLLNDLGDLSTHRCSQTSLQGLKSTFENRTRMLLKMLPTVYSQFSLRMVPKMLTSILIHPLRNGIVCTHSGNFGLETRVCVFPCYTANISLKVLFRVQLHSSSLETRQSGCRQHIPMAGGISGIMNINCLSINQVSENLPKCHHSLTGQHFTAVQKSFSLSFPSRICTVTFFFLEINYSSSRV